MAVGQLQQIWNIYNFIMIDIYRYENFTYIKGLSTSITPISADTHA
jgi:hypothetical protein